MARTHCTGPGTGQGQGPGAGRTVHIAVQEMVKGIQDTYGLVPDLVVKWVLNPLLPSTIPGSRPCVVCTVHSIIKKTIVPGSSPCPCVVCTVHNII